MFSEGVLRNCFRDRELFYCDHLNKLTRLRVTTVESMFPTVGRGDCLGSDLCELKNTPETQKCPKTFVHDCRSILEPSKYLLRNSSKDLFLSSMWFMESRSYLIKSFTRRDRNNNNKHPQQTNNNNQGARGNIIIRFSKCTILGFLVKAFFDERIRIWF